MKLTRFARVAVLGCTVTLVTALSAGRAGAQPASSSAGGAASASQSVLAPEHPRVFFRKSDIPQIRKNIETIPDAARRWDDMLKRTDPGTAIEFPPPKTPVQSGWSRAVNSMATNAARCGVIYQLTGDANYAAWVKRLLLAWTKEFDTRLNFQLCSDYLMPPESGSGAKEGGNFMGYYLMGSVLRDTALAYDCIVDTLGPEDRRTIEDGYFRKWVGVAEGYDHSRREPPTAPDFMVAGGQWNGAMQCNSGLAAVGFLLGDERLYERAVRNFKMYVGRDFLSDGSWMEEDLLYAQGSVGTLFSIAWMARSSGYPEDLFRATMQAQPPESYDHRYYTSMPSCDGNAPTQRTLLSFLDAQIDYQYPDFSPGDWAWTPGRGSLQNARTTIAMFNLGYAVTGNPRYAYVLQNVDRGKASLDGGGLDLLLFARPIDKIAPADTGSHWYPHGRWVALKSIEGPAYWKSDCLYAFMPYGHERNKGLQPLTLDLFAYGRVFAPQTALSDYAQNYTKAYQANDPGWNTVMVDGYTIDFFHSTTERDWMEYHDFGPLAKVAAPRIHLLGARRATLMSSDLERHPEEDRTMGRTVVLTDAYALDVVRVAYDKPPKYKHNFDYVLHGYGKLSFEGLPTAISTDANVTAVWKREDGYGLRSTVLSAGERGGTKFKRYSDPRTDFMVATRGDFLERFLVVHEPFKGEPRIASVSCLADGEDFSAVEVRMKDGTVDQIAVRTAPTNAPRKFKTLDGKSMELKGNYLFVRTLPDKTVKEQSR
jgi:hypothetical protein